MKKVFISSVIESWGRCCILCITYASLSCSPRAIGRVIVDVATPF